MARKRLTVSIEEDAVWRLRTIARERGLISRAGPQTGEGNISALLEETAYGRMAVARLRKRTPEAEESEEEAEERTLAEMRRDMVQYGARAVEAFDRWLDAVRESIEKQTGRLPGFEEERDAEATDEED